MEVTLDTLIIEGDMIRRGITYVPAGEGYVRMYSVHKLADNSVYEIWKNKVIRFLSSNFKEDRCISDFETSAKEFEKSHYAPTIFDKLMGVLESCKIIPLPISSSSNLNAPKQQININMSQAQSQQQTQELILAVFIESIKDELTGKQYKELKEIAEQEPDPKKAKTKLLDKIKGFGENVTASIIANILTNPNIWGNI